MVGCHASLGVGLAYTCRNWESLKIRYNIIHALRGSREVASGLNVWLAPYVLSSDLGDETIRSHRILGSPSRSFHQVTSNCDMELNHLII